MTRPDALSHRRRTVEGGVRTALAAAMLTVGAAVASAATAAADEPVPPPPAPADPAPAPTGFLPAPGSLQSFVPDGGMAPGSGYDFLLGQSPIPATTSGQPNQAPAPGTIIDPQAIAALRPTNFALTGQGQQSIYSNTPAAPDAPPAGLIDNAKGMHGLWNYQMGKLDPTQLGQPLPGTAPPPGTNIPVGLAPQPDPAAPPPPGAPLPAPPAG